AEELLNRLLSSELGKSRLRINRHDAAGRFVYESIDKNSGEVVKQFPPEKILEVLAFYNEAQGLVIDDEA
ncbi:MAG: flagellar protein FlaG, partial [Sphingomonadales bacterium]|nr:flagellar protein FlaG [Sphingomonadales bacterium]